MSLVFRHQDLAPAKMLTGYGFPGSPLGGGENIETLPSWNFRLTNLQAALGVAQLERLDDFLARKRHMGQRYTELLSDVPGLQLPLIKTDYADNIYWVYGLVRKKEVPFDAEKAMHLRQVKGTSKNRFSDG